MSTAEAAIALHLPVFPCGPDKRPRTPHGWKDAASEPGRIRALWWRHPGPFIGVPTGGVSGLTVIDIDPKGMSWLVPLLRRDGLPQTRIHRTPRGGYHFLYLTPEPPIGNSAGKIAPGVDIRGAGGYAVFPPSPGYEVIDESGPAPFPRWIIRALERNKKSVIPGTYNNNSDAAPLARFIASSPVGERNNRAFWAACRAAESGIGASARQSLTEAAMQCGLDAREAAAVIASGLKRGGGRT